MKTNLFIRGLVVGLQLWCGDCLRVRAEDQPEMVHEVLHDFEAMPINPSKHLLRHGDYSRKLLLRVPGRLGLGHGAETGCEGGLPGDDFHNLQAEGDDEAVHDVIQKGGA